MSAVLDTSVLGASLGSSGLRSVISDNARPGPVLEVHEPVASQPAPNGLAPDPWDTVITSMHDLAAEYASPDFYPVLALRERDPRTAYDRDLCDGVLLVSELGAQLGALRETRVVAGERCVALFDIGASGTSVSVVDVESGRVLAARRTDELSGDYCDRMLCDHLIATFGAAEALTVDARRRLVHDVRDGKHQLSLLRSVSVLGPFVGGRATLWRADLDELIGDRVHRAAAVAVGLLDAVAAQGVHVDAIIAVGGGANMQIVRQVLFDAVSVPVYVPEQPELLAARGATGIARTVGIRPHERDHERGAAVSTTEMSTAARAVSAGGGVVSKRPRHSDTSSRRTSRANKSRHLGGALAALVAVCAAGTVVAAAARTTGDVPEPSAGTSQNIPATARSQAVSPAVDDSPADASPTSESVVGTTTTAVPATPTTGASAPAAPPSSASTASPPVAATNSASAAHRPGGTGTTVTGNGASGSGDSDTPDPTTVRPTQDAETHAPTTTSVPPVTTTVPPTTTRPSSTTRPPSTTTRPTRTFDFPLPDFGLPRG